MTCHSPQVSWLSSAEEKLSEGGSIPSAHIAVARAGREGAGECSAALHLHLGNGRGNFPRALMASVTWSPAHRRPDLGGLSLPGAAGFFEAHAVGSWPWSRCLLGRTAALDRRVHLCLCSHPPPHPTSSAGCFHAVQCLHLDRSLQSFFSDFVNRGSTINKKVDSCRPPFVPMCLARLV